MEGVIGVLQSILGTEDDYLETYLNALEEHDSFHTKSSAGTEKVVQYISSALSKSDTCRVGLILLKCYMKHATLDVVEAKALLWSNLTMKTFNFKDADSIVTLIYSALSALALNCNRLPEISKSFASNHLPKLYESLGKISPLGYLAALKCTETCLRIYPGPSGPYRGILEKFLAKFIDIPDEGLNIWSGKCIHLLQQVRGGGVQGISHKSAWMNYQKKLLGSLHDVLDFAYANCTELYDKHGENEKLECPALELSDEPANRAMQLFIRFRNLVNYLTIALQEPFPVAKPVLPKKILTLISRGLSVTCLILQNNPISDNLTLELLLPKMHCSLMNLVKTLILTLKMNLKLHNHAILGFVADTLQWTSPRKNDSINLALIPLRCKAYEVLTLWCTIMGHGSRVEIISEALIKDIMFDILPPQNEFTLQVLSGSKKHMSKKARRQLHKTQNEQSNLSQLHAHKNSNKKDTFLEEGNKEVCVAALECLQNIFIAATNLLKPTLIKMIHIKIIQICGSFYTSSVNRQHLYQHNWECRLALYKLMHIFIEQTHRLCPPPTQITIHIFQTARVSDGNYYVRKQCSEMLAVLEKIIHPNKNGLLFPTDSRDIRNTFIKFGQEHLLKDPMDLNIRDENSLSDDEELHITSEERNKSEDRDVLLKDTATPPRRDSPIFSGAEEDNFVTSNKTNDIAHNTDPVIDLTSTKNPITCQKSNTDSVKTVECPSTESKAPEIILIDEDDNSVDIIEDQTLDKHSDIISSEPATKKQKLEDLNFGLVVSSNLEDDLLAEIEATFVDELN